MTTNPASIWALIRAGQKDESYAERLAASLGDSLKTLLGTGAWIRTQERITVPATALLYHLLTTGSGRQTPGEEYCSLLQVISKSSTESPSSSYSWEVPSTSRRLLLCLLASLHTHLLGAFTKVLASISEKCLHLKAASSHDRLDDLRATIQYAFSTAQAVNRAAFYFTGRYLELGKRLLSIGYLSTSGSGSGFFGSSSQTSSSSTSTLLGCLSLLQVVLSLYSRYGLLTEASGLSPENPHQSSSTSNSEVEIPPQPSSSSSSTKSCLLCLSTRRQPTLLPCGHIFCWPCLTSWLQFRAECPTCRRPVAETGRLVYLHNYS